LGQQTLYGIGMTGIPVYNVNNNCSTGSTALYMAYNAIRFGQNDAVLALGFEKMQKGPLENQLPGLEKIKEETEKEKAPPIAARMFGDAGRDHMEKYGTKKETFAKIAVKNHVHSVNNPRSQYQAACSLEEVLAARMIYDPLTILQCCPTSDGAAAAIVVSESYLKAHPHTGAIEILAMAMATDKFEDFARGRIGMIGMGMTERASRAVYEQAGLGPKDAQVIELHDCFSTNELITYEGLGLCAEGEGEKLVEENACTYGGRWVVNPSGGLLSKGHPLGATGLAQCAELVWQVRGQAEKRQVEGAKIALQHNLGLGGACVVAMYARA
jgi:acetyl-CoA acetyltransferase